MQGATQSRSNVLITAWNDSGAGLFTRLIDSVDDIFCFPFETLLGSNNKAGIASCPDLVNPSYRWNAFRFSSQHGTSRDESTHPRSSHQFAESELRAWLAGKKFDVLNGYKANALRTLCSYTSRCTEENAYSLQETIGYLDALENVFCSKLLAIRAMHVPCAMLDYTNPNFFVIFEKVIALVIDPRWGFGNMTTRNSISLKRYLKRWLAINQSTRAAQKAFPGKVLVLRSSTCKLDIQENISNAVEFILGEKFDIASPCLPTLLKQRLKYAGYPFGGVLSWDSSHQQFSRAVTAEHLKYSPKTVQELAEDCDSLFREMTK